MLEVIDLGCERDDRILFENLPIQLSSGELLQVEGPNGAGKTTLLRILAGLSSDYQGELRWNGKKMSSVYAGFRLSTFYFGHRPAIKSELTPVENMRWRARLRNDHYTDSQIANALEQVDLAGYEDVMCGQLSAGQHRRVAFADLASCSAPLWILDEPFTAIDVKGVAWLEALIAHHVRGGGMVIITSHQKLSEMSGQIKKVSLAQYVSNHVEDQEVFL